MSGNGLEEHTDVIDILYDISGYHVMSGHDLV